MKEGPSVEPIYTVVFLSSFVVDDLFEILEVKKMSVKIFLAYELKSQNLNDHT